LNNINETHHHRQQDNYFHPPFLHVDYSIKNNVTDTTTTGMVVGNHRGAVMKTAYDCLISLSCQVDQMILRYSDEGKKTTNFWSQDNLLSTGFFLWCHLYRQAMEIELD
jgi:hypothetical protein